MKALVPAVVGETTTWVAGPAGRVTLAVFDVRACGVVLETGPAANDALAGAHPSE